jgi:hypothetical protein
MKTIHLPPFSTAAFLDELRAAGVKVRLEAGQPRAKFTDECPLTIGILEAMKERRAELIAIMEAERAEVDPVATAAASALLDGLRARGFAVKLAGEQVQVRGGGALDEETVARLKGYKGTIIRLLRAVGAS